MSKRGVTIHFKNNKVSRVTGARSERERAEAAVFGQGFVQELERVTKEKKNEEAEVEPPTDGQEETVSR